MIKEKISVHCLETAEGEFIPYARILKQDMRGKIYQQSVDFSRLSKEQMAIVEKNCFCRLRYTN